MRKLLIVLLVLAAPAFAVNRTVKAGGGGDFTTVAACITAMSASGGDTCTVFAGTYAESVTVKAGTAGNYNILTVNGSDIVTVTRINPSSHTKIIGNFPVLQGTVTTATGGFFITNPSSPGTTCMSASSITDAFVQNNAMYACGPLSFTGPTTNLVFSGNTLSYPSGTVASPNAGPQFVTVACNGCLFELNDLSHNSDTWGEITAPTSGNMFRKNGLHDNLATDCGSNSGNCHIDGFFSEGTTTKNNFFELNTYYHCDSTGFSGAGCHVILQQADACAGNCAQTVWRFNQSVNVYTAGVENDNSWLGFYNYNNTEVDVANSHGTGATGIADQCSHNATNCNYLNNIYLYNFSVTNFNAIANYSGGVFTQVSNNMAWCLPGSCTQLFGTAYESGTWAGSGQLFSNPLLVAPNSTGLALGNNALQSGSPARNAGKYLTTAVGAGVSSTTMVVTDSGFFQAFTNIPGVQADGIRVSSFSNPTVLITANNYATNTLTLASPISWANGDHVWVCSLSDGTNVCTDTTGPDIGAVPFSSGGGGGSFTASPTTIPAHHAGNITVTLTGVGTAWSGSTVFSIAGVTGASLVNSTNNSATSQTLKITTGSGTGTLTITDTTDAISATISVATATLAISPTSGLSGTTPTLTMTGTNTLWLSETPAGLFTVTGGTGSSIGTPTVTSNTAATVVLTPGSSAGSETITDTSTTATATFSVSAPPVLTIIVSGSGTETSSPAGIACPPTCSATFAPGTAITLTPTPGSGTGPVGWTGSACPSTAIVCKLTLNSNQTVTALFGICAAPNYCGNTSTANVPTFVAPFSAASPVNSIGYGTALNSPPLVPYTRITDRTTFNGASVGNNSCGGGAFERMCSVNDVRCFVSTSGGFAYALELNLSGNFGQLINTGTLPTTDRVLCPVETSWVSDSISYGVVTNASAPFIAINQSTWPGNNTHTTSTLVDIGSGTTCPGIPAGTSTHVGGFSVGQNDAFFGMDLSYAGGQDTGAWGAIWSPTLGCATANFAPSGPDWSAGTVYVQATFITPTTGNAGGFTYEVKTAGTGGGSRPTFNQTPGASVADGTAVLVNIGIAGAYYAFCTSSCTPTTPKTGLMATASTCTTGTNCSCWGGYIHNSQMSADGTDLSISFSDGQVMSAGACSGHTSSALRTDWAPGTANTQWGHANGTDAGGDFYDGHPIFGVNHVVSAGGTGYYYRSIANIINLTQFQSIPSSLCGNESHISWPNPLSIDNYPAIFATSELPASGCGTNNAPLAFGNEVYAGFPQAVNQPFVRLAQTFSCNPNNALWVPCAGGSDVQFACANGIVTTTNSGNYALIASGMLLGLGLDSSSQPACDLFIAKIGGAPPRPAPTNTVLMGKSAAFHYGIEPILNQGASR